MAELARVTVFPVKSLDGLALERATVGDRGALDLDREYALFDADGDYVNGKATSEVHRIASWFDPGTHALTVDAPGMDEATFALADADGRAAAGAWFSDFFGREVTVEPDDAGGFPDDEALHGPTVISTATLRAVAGWFDLPVESVRRRFRANLELGGGDDDLPAFWEDRLFADHGEAVPFEIGGVTFEGRNPCQRCVVPTRDPDTGEALAGFRETFVRRRRETLPEWTDSDRFDHPYRLMVNTVVPESAVGGTLQTGDAVSVGDVRATD
ncbi:MAG: MOSC domain-containing protein [Halorientalis sp.]